MTTQSIEDIEERKEHPDLAIEVAFTSSDTKKLD
jgi:Uma2 family endonuclease